MNDEKYELMRDTSECAHLIGAKPKCIYRYLCRKNDTKDVSLWSKNNELNLHKQLSAERICDIAMHHNEWKVYQMKKSRYSENFAQYQ